MVAGFPSSASAVPAAGLRLAGATLGLTGSAAANLVGQAGGAAVCRCVTGRAGVAATGLFALQLMMARDLIVRTLAFRLLCLGRGGGRGSAPPRRGPPGRVAVAGSSCAGSDSLAIAAQSLVGAALGAGDAGHAKAVAWRVTAFSLLAVEFWQRR